MLQSRSITWSIPEKVGSHWWCKWEEFGWSQTALPSSAICIPTLWVSMWQGMEKNNNKHLETTNVSFNSWGENPTIKKIMRRIWNGDQHWQRANVDGQWPRQTRALLDLAPTLSYDRQVHARSPHQDRNNNNNSNNGYTGQGLRQLLLDRWQSSLHDNTRDNTRDSHLTVPPLSNALHSQWCVQTFSALREHLL